MDAIIESLKNNTGWYTTVLVAILTLIQITPIKINPWSWILKKVGALLFGEINTKIDAISKDVENLKKESAENNAINVRVRILDFAEKIHTNPSKEQFEQSMGDVDKYEKYCKEHEEFANGIAVLAIDAIKSEYKRRFLT